MNTRFNPTTNGDASKGILHLGHIYLVLVNEHAAHSTGGTFTVRFDDNQKYWLRELGVAAIADNCEQIKRELDWMGIRVDHYVKQSELEPFARHDIGVHFPGLEEPVQHTYVPTLIREDAPQYPYAPWLTAEVVYADYLSEVTTLICGDELLDRYALYCYMAERMGIPQIEHVYLPRLRDGGELAPVSKTEGNHRVWDYRARGFSPSILRAMLAHACLDDPCGTWDWHNVKRAPRLRYVEARHSMHASAVGESMQEFAFPGTYYEAKGE